MAVDAMARSDVGDASALLAAVVRSGASRQVAAAVAAALLRTLADLRCCAAVGSGDNDSVADELGARMELIAPVLAEQVKAGRDGREPAISGCARALRNCAAHDGFGSGVSQLPRDGQQAKRRQRGRRNGARDTRGAQDLELDGAMGPQGNVDLAEHFDIASFDGVEGMEVAGVGTFRCTGGACWADVVDTGSDGSLCEAAQVVDVVGDAYKMKDDVQVLYNMDDVEEPVRKLKGKFGDGQNEEQVVASKREIRTARDFNLVFGGDVADFRGHPFAWCPKASLVQGAENVLDKQAGKAVLRSAEGAKTNSVTKDVGCDEVASARSVGDERKIKCLVRLQAWWRSWYVRAAISHACNVQRMSLCKRSKSHVALMNCAAHYDDAGLSWWRDMALKSEAYGKKDFVGVIAAYQPRKVAGLIN
jgi:hypothetical protein